ncbi:MAG: hypothetical protein ACM3OB_08500, partial [Acidobacteriota bacterium]
MTHDPVPENHVVVAAVQADGSFLVAWTRSMTYANGWRGEEFVAQAFDVNGLALGPLRVVDLRSSWTEGQAVALPDGRYALAWSGDQGLRAQILDATGTPLGIPFPLTYEVGEGGDYLRFVATENGYAALWVQRLTDSKAFRLRLYTRDGSPASDSILIAPSTSSLPPDYSFGDLAPMPGGGLCVAWSEDSADQQPATLTAQVLNQYGIAATPRGVVVDTFSGAGGMYPHVVSNGDGSCTVLWMRSGVLAARKLDASAHLGPVFYPTAVETYGLGFDVASDAHGHLWAAGGCANYLIGDLPHGLWFVDETGRQVSAPLDAISTRLATSSALAANQWGGAVLAWIGNGTGYFNDHRDVFVRRFRSTCVPGGLHLCLGPSGRFALDAVWHTPDGNQGPATPAPLRSDTGGFWFFSPSNVELLAKVLDGRAVNDHFWVLWG